MPTPLPSTLPAGLWALAAAVVVGALMGLLTGPLLRALPEPDRDADGKLPYTALATPGFAAAVGLLCGGATLLAGLRADPAHWVAWAALGTANVLACAIDARTTWLPRRLSVAGWLLAAAGAVLAAVAASAWQPAAAAALGALATGGFFHMVWRVTGQLGYGDVRLAATIGAVTALGSPMLVAWSLLAGTTLGALTGVAHRLLGGKEGFPYGPGLLAGAYVALLLPPGWTGAA